MESFRALIVCECQYNSHKLRETEVDGDIIHNE